MNPLDHVISPPDIDTEMDLRMLVRLPVAISFIASLLYVYYFIRDKQAL